MEERRLDVLLVEGDGKEAERVNRAFAAHGRVFRLVVRDSVKKALHYVADFSPHLVITNLALPDGTGLKLLSPEGNPKRIPVLVLSEREDQEEARQARNAGALKVVVKTEDSLNDLPALAESALQSRREDRAGTVVRLPLQQSEARSREVLNSLPDLVFRIGEDGTFLECDGAEEGSLAPCRQFVGRRIAEVLPAEAANRALHTLETILRSRRRQTLEVELPVTDGVIVCEVHMAAAGDRQAVAVFRDLTQRRGREEETRRLRRVAALGGLVGAIAHEFNNVLTGILVQADLMLMRLDPGDPLYENADEIRRVGVRAATTVLMLQAFSGTQEFSPRPVDLNGLVLKMKKTLRLFVGEAVALGDHLGSDLGHVYVDPSHIEQIILTLAAETRVHDGKAGAFTIRTGNVIPEENNPLRTGVIPADRRVLLSVSTAGAHVGEPSQRVLIEPEGLPEGQGQASHSDPSLIPGIVDRNGGELKVYAHGGGGVTYEITFPHVVPPREAPAQEVEQAGLPSLEPLRSPGEVVVLLVEDNDMVMGALSSLLKKEGYKVLEAHDGQEALLVSGRFAGKIHLMVSDVKMPNLGGVELAEELGRLNPDMRVLFISGYPKETLFPGGVVDFGKAFLSKPITRDGLLRKVRQLLEAPANKGDPARGRA